jgi:O-acetylhomoserine/O-acetylserine sulfhydrylase-like pyridoxal-dependent enzyme
LNNIALICGGYNVFDDCFAITDKTLQANVTLIQHRDAAASVVLDSTTLWLTGGFSDTGGTKSTEFVR